MSETLIGQTILPCLFVSAVRDNGFLNWTLATELGVMLREIAQIYGPIVIGYTFLGIEFHEEGPQIWFPGDCGHVAIRLGLNSMMDEKLAYWQLAQECIHLLSPTTGRASVLEEGLATKFAREYMLRKHYWTASATPINYNEADNMAVQLLQRWPDCIKQMRQEEPVIARFTPELVERYCAGIDLDIVTRLLAEHAGR